MRKVRLYLTLMSCVFALVHSSQAQSRKAGLWEMTSKTTILQPGSRVGAPTNNGTSTQAQASEPEGLPVCLTQAQIDKYGVILPPSLRDCEISNVVQKPNSFSADMMCKGAYNGKGSIESIWTDDDHASGKVRFVAKSRDSAAPMSIAWTQESTAVFKSPDCGSVKPRPMPTQAKQTQMPLPGAPRP
jgi:Protein of unknown function (DUF3617)